MSGSFGCEVSFTCPVVHIIIKRDVKRLDMPPTQSYDSIFMSSMCMKMSQNLLMAFLKMSALTHHLHRCPGNILIHVTWSFEKLHVWGKYMQTIIHPNYSCLMKPYPSKCLISCQNTSFIIWDTSLNQPSKKAPHQIHHLLLMKMILFRIARKFILSVILLNW